MKSIKSVLLILISSLIYILFGLEVYATSSISENENIIFSGSVEDIIIDNSNKILSGSATTESVSPNTDVKEENNSNTSKVLDKLLKKKIENGISNQDTTGTGISVEQKLIALNEDSSQIKEVDIINKLETKEPVNDVRYFIVTAYYSPMSGQKTYITGSYAGDVRLNGEGRHTASGKKVFDGLLAAPSNYKFGTKIELEGMGVGEVSDRGGAIVNSGISGNSFDRIDVWMGYGDEGLYRALKWGKRKVMGKIVPSTRQLSMDFAGTTILEYGDLVVDAKKPIENDVIRLQNLLTEVKIYNGVIDGKYESIKDVLIKYQVENNIISSEDDNEAGYFGTKTLAVLREEFGSDVFKTRDNKLDDDLTLSTEIKEKLNLLNNKVSLLIDNKFGKNTPKSIEYREKLRELILRQTKKTRNETKKNQLKYLVSVL
ncbi:MAG: hypothetical protein Q8K30_00390 [Candidatus Gracilibacteria bacterium]|nr:hypothetical protein [Candidatus Gracilibacteria bacterium]